MPQAPLSYRWRCAVSIDIQRDKLLSLSEAAKLVPGKQPHIQTLHRWHRCGLYGHRLEVVTVGGKKWTTEAALFRFLEAVSAYAGGV